MEWVYVIPILVAIITSIVSLIIACMAYKQNQALLKEKKIEEQRKHIYKKLHEFYGPLIAQINTSQIYHEIFMRDKPDDFRALLHLLNPDQLYNINTSQEQKIELSKNDMIILRKIINIWEIIEHLINEKAGLIEDEELLFHYRSKLDGSEFEDQDAGLIPRAIVHLQLLRMALDGEIKNDIDRLKDYVYPREINDKVKQRINQLQAELMELNRTE